MNDKESLEHYTCEKCGKHPEALSSNGWPIGRSNLAGTSYTCPSCCRKEDKDER